MSLIIEEINRRHNRKSFDCGVNELNEFLQHQARQKNAKQISKTFVACETREPNNIIGYYTITGYSVAIPPEHKYYQKYPHPLSAVKLARLAVGRSYQKQYLGENLLIDAINRTVLVAEQISAIGLFVDPMNSGITPFYEQYGFLLADPGNNAKLEMWLPIKNCIEVVSCLL